MQILRRQRHINHLIRITATLLVLVMVCGSNAACKNESTEALRFGLSSAPAILDPRYATDATSARINRLLYRRLVDFDDSGKVVTSIASWEKVSPLHYKFVLGNSGREFHDGTRLTTNDVKATYESVLHDEPVSPHRATLRALASIEVSDAQTIHFHLSQADPLFPAYLVIGILPQHAIAQKHPFERNPIGSGAFTFLDWKDTESLRLQRNRDGQIVEFMRVADPSVRVLKLLRGEIDIVQNDLPTELVRYLRKQDDISLEQRRGSNFSYLGFNLEDPVTGQLKVRQAIAHAIDRQALVQHVLGGAARLAESMLPPEHWAGHAALPGFEFDPAKARKLLSEADLDPSRTLSITYKTSSDPVRIRLATILQHQLKEIGIEVNLLSYDWGTFYGDIKNGRFQMYSLAWVGIKTPDIFHYVFHSSSVPPGGANRGRYRDALVDGLFARLTREPALEKHRQLYLKIQERVSEQLPYVPLWYEDHIYAARKDVQGYRLASDGNYDGLQYAHKSRQPAHVSGLTQ